LLQLLREGEERAEHTPQCEEREEGEGEGEGGEGEFRPNLVALNGHL